MKHSEIDLCGDETSRETASYGVPGDGITGQIYNKPGIAKGVQKVLVSYVPHIRLCAYRHRHKLNVKPTGCNLWEKIDVKEIMEVTKLMVEGEEGNKRKISHKHPQ